MFRSPGFLGWLILLAVSFLSLAGVVRALGGKPQKWTDWLIVVILSALIATILFGLWRLIRWLWIRGKVWLRLRRALQRALRPALFLLACLATLMALFYAEEDWRGRHAWNQFRRAEEAKGERFDWASMVPPPVPDDQNFALTPIMASCYGQNLDRMGHPIWSGNDHQVNRLDMDYWVRGSQDFPPTSSDEWMLGNRMDLSPFQRYYQRMAVQTNLFPVPPQPQSPAADVLLALSRFDGTIEELRRASRLPLSRFQINYFEEDPFAFDWPHIVPLIGFARGVFTLRTTAEVRPGFGRRATPATDGRFDPHRAVFNHIYSATGHDALFAAAGLGRVGGPPVVGATIKGAGRRSG